MNLALLLRRAAGCVPALPAVARGDTAVLSYAALARRVGAVAASMRAAGLSIGDRVALVSGNCPEYVELLFACWHAGLAAVPVNSKLHPQEAAFILGDSGARWAFVDRAWRDALSPLAASMPSLARVLAIGTDEYRKLVAAGEAADAGVAPAPEPLAADAPAWLFYTSGTTGRPKGVALTHDNLLAMAQCFLADVESIEPGDSTLHAAPMSHGSGLYIVPHVLRCAVNVVPESGGFDPDEVARLVARWPGCCFFAAPTMLMRLVRSKAAATVSRDHLKSIVFGGGPMYVRDCRDAWSAFPGRLAQIYGQGESPMTITAMPRALIDDAIARDDQARLGSVGVAQSGIELRVGGPDDAALSTGEPGEVLVRGRAVMAGYWNNPAASAAALANGWLHTGDVGALDRDGFLTLKDRSKDLIISGGANIYPREVEEVLLRHPRVAEVAVVGRRHPEWGEEVVACIVTHDGAPIPYAELEELCLAHIARFKRPRDYRFVAELPKNDTGKILKTRLREIVREA